LRRLHIFASTLASFCVVAGLLVAAPAHAGAAQKDPAVQELKDQLESVHTGQVAQSATNEYTALEISQALLSSADPARYFATPAVPLLWTRDVESTRKGGRK